MLGRFSGLEEYLLHLSVALCITALISLFMVVINGVALLRLIAVPFCCLISATKMISSGDLAHSIVLGTHNEIGKLARVLDGLRVNLMRSEDIRRQMLADIAHELRSSMAILRGKVEAMLDGIQQLHTGSLSGLSDRILRLSHLVDGLQDIAFAEANEFLAILIPST